jgi:hypothetical protein
VNEERPDAALPDEEEESSPEACLAARELFARALDEEEAARQLDAHAAHCAPCRDAFAELREMVERLTRAADAVPASRAFAPSVMASIRAERGREERRRRQQLFLIGGGALAGALLALLGLVAITAVSRGEGAAALPTPAASAALTGSLAAAASPAASPAPTASPAPAASVASATASPAPTAAPLSPEAQRARLHLREFERHLAERLGAGPGRLPPDDMRRLAITVHRRFSELAAGLSPDELAALVERLEGEAPADAAEARARALLLRAGRRLQADGRRR